MSDRHFHGQGCDCDHDAGPDAGNLGILYSLYKRIHLDEVECLNEAVESSGKTVFRPWEERLSKEKFVESDVDEELLFNIPFAGCVKLKGIIVIGAEGPFHPAKMRMFKNQPKMTFDLARKPADQEFDLQEDPTGTLEYAPKVVTFSSVTHLTLHFPTNFGADQTRIYFIGLKGEFSAAPRQGIVICSYETTPNMADHEVVNSDFVATQIL